MAKAMYVGVVDNLVPNGTFDTFDGWVNNNPTSMPVSVVDGFLYIPPTSSTVTYQRVYTEKAISLTKGHIYYMAVKYWKTGGGQSRWGLHSNATNKSHNLIAISGATSGWTINSAIYTATETTETNVLLYGTGATYSTDLSMKWDDVMVIDLTDLFGAGKEPTLEWCNENISYSANSISVAGANVGTARKVKKMYIGVGGVAKKVKKAYIGVNGVARLFFTAGELKYHGEATALSVARSYLAGASTKNHALFAGGATGSSVYSAVVDAYDSNLTRSKPTALSVARYYPEGANAGDYAVFAGGYGSGGRKDTVDAYDVSLTRSTPTALSVARYRFAGASVGGYALFAGGYASSYSAVVDAYDSKLTRSTPTALSVARQYHAGAHVPNYALFSCGTISGGHTTAVDAYDKSLTRSTPTASSAGKSDVAGVSMGNFAFFAGGLNGSTNYSTVEVYDNNLTKIMADALSWARYNIMGAKVGDCVIFAGGSTGSVQSMTDAYDSSLTRSTMTGISVAREYGVGATVGDYGLIAGGRKNVTTQYSNVDAYAFN